MSDGLIQLASLWTREGKEGNKYLSGSLDPEGVAALKRAAEIGEIKIMVFRADQRGNNRAPTHRVYIAHKQRRPSQGHKPERRRDDDIGF